MASATVHLGVGEGGHSVFKLIVGVVHVPHTAKKMASSRQIRRVAVFGCHCRNECSFYPVMFNININNLHCIFIDTNIHMYVPYQKVLMTSHSGWLY